MFQNGWTSFQRIQKDNIKSRSSKNECSFHIYLRFRYVKKWSISTMAITSWNVVSLIKIDGKTNLKEIEMWIIIDESEWKCYR